MPHECNSNVCPVGIASQRDAKPFTEEMSENPTSDRGTILLISDRQDNSRELAGFLNREVGPCHLISRGGEAGGIGTLAAIILDIRFYGAHNIEPLRRLLAQARTEAAPVLAILRDSSRLEEVQAVALGATSLIHPGSFRQTCLAIEQLLEPVVECTSSPGSRTPKENVEQARVEFGKMFRAAGSAGTVTRAGLDNAADSVVAAITDGGVREWLEVVWNYDDVTYQHCMLVTGLAAEFARCLGFSEKDQRHLVRGALLHDLGKAKVPLVILNKPDRLSAEELEIMRAHPQLGYQLLQNQGGYETELLDVVLHHHEFLDGSGYPDGLIGAQIRDLVRLVTICDIYAALIERRPYREPMHPGRAFATLQEMGNKLETVLVREFARVAENLAVAIAA